MRMSISNIVARFAKSGEMSSDEMIGIVRGAGDGSIPEAELAAFLMAVLEREAQGKAMSYELAAAYTKAMAYSGLVFDWSELPWPCAARHTPGIVGDNQSVPVDAILRACDIASINITGKRLIHTPGTLERLDTIPGFHWSLSPDEVRRQMATLGMVITGQTSEITPADGRLYALREKIGAVQCLAHICASVMSKKIASGAKYLSLTVTYGPAAIMDTFEQAERCAGMMVGIGQQLGVQMVGEMFNGFDSVSRHLGTGSLSMRACIHVLRNDAPKDEIEVVLHSAAPLILAAGKADTMEAAMALAQRTLENGSAAEWFRKLVEAQGGEPRVVDDLNGVLGTAHTQRAVLATKSGYVKPNIRALGYLAHELTGPFKGEGWYPQGGMIVSPCGRYGQYVSVGEPLCVIHAKDAATAAALHGRVRDAFEIGEESLVIPPRFSPLPSAN